MTVRVFSCFCDNVILPSFITLIGYQKETKSQVNPKVTLSQVNNSMGKKDNDREINECYNEVKLGRQIEFESEKKYEK